MCYAKPEPRCAASARNLLEKAKLIGNNELILEATDIYDETTEGLAILSEKVSDKDLSSRERMDLSSRLLSAQMRRKMKLDLYRAQKGKEPVEQEEDSHQVSPVETSTLLPPLEHKSVMFRTVHGSRLYGLNHAASDDDFYQVINRSTSGKKKFARQNIAGNDDTMTVNFSTFSAMANEGIPQSLEAMFSAQSLGTEYFEAYRKSFRVDINSMRKVYRRTIANFACGDFKRRRHALRLAFNFDEATYSGRFNPQLTPEQITFVNEQAEDLEAYLPRLLEIFPYITAPQILERGTKDKHDIHQEFLAYAEAHPE